MIKDIALLDKKSGYIDFLSLYSFGSEEEVFYSAINDQLNQSKDINLRIINLGIFISTLNKKRLIDNERIIESELVNIYSNYKNDKYYKFLDFVISQDFGKLLNFKKKWFELIFTLVLDRMDDISDEMASYVLKTLATSSQIRIELFKEISHQKFLELIFALVKKVLGRTGGLLREIGFNIRRLPVSESISIDCLNIFEFFQENKLNSQLKYSAYCIFSKIFAFNSLSLVKLLLLVDRTAAEMIFSVQKGSRISWSNIQNSLVAESIQKYNEIAFDSLNLNEFYSRINKVKRNKFENKRKIGVILTTHNPDIEVIGYSIDSVLNQTCGNIQLCIVDDFSDKDIYEKLKRKIDEFHDERIIFIRNQKNSGQYVSRNTAMNAMPDAEFYAIQDDDDVSHPDRLRIQYDFMRENSEVALCLAQQVRFNKDMVYVPDRVNPLDFDFGPASSFYKKEIVKKIGGFMNVRSRGDVEFINRIKNTIGNDSIGFLKIPLYIMRSDLSSVSSVRDFQFKTQIDIYKKQMRNGMKLGVFQYALFS
jgi:hypothetical protein